MSSPDGATWRSGYATVCKTVYTSSILVVASINHLNNGYNSACYVPANRLAAGSPPILLRVPMICWNLPYASGHSRNALGLNPYFLRKLLLK
jgi:hypothetical protein